MKIEIDKSFIKKLKGRVEGFEFQVGVLEDKTQMQPIETPMFEDPQLSTYAGGPVRKKSRNKSELTTGQILVKNMERLGINILQEPFEKKNSEILKFTEGFLKLVTQQKISIKRVENLLQAIVRNPILKQMYGANSAFTADSKGFDRHLFDTGQMFRAIKAKVTKRV